MMKIEIKVDDLYFCSVLLVKPEPLLIKAKTDETQLPSAPLAANPCVCPAKLSM
jgi:hypothetical protein